MSRAELSEDMKALYDTNLFESVNTKVEPTKRGKYKVRPAGLGWAGGTLWGAHVQRGA